MKKNPILTIVLITTISVVLVMVILNLLGYDNGIAIGGGIAGGVAGAISSSMIKKKTN